MDAETTHSSTASSAPASASRHARLAWSFAVFITIGCLVGGVLSLLALRAMPSAIGGTDYSQLLLLPFIAPIYAWVGALVLARRPNAIGWLFCLIAIAFCAYELGIGYASWGVLVAEQTPPGIAIAAWFGAWIQLVGVLAIPLVFLLYPNGSPPSKRWRPVVWAAWFVLVVSTTKLAFSSEIAGPWQEAGIRLGGPWGAIDRASGGGLLTATDTAASWLLVFVTLASIVAPIWRYRGAAREERRQLRWMALIPTVVLVFFVGGFAVSILARDTAVNDFFGTVFWGVLPYLVLAGIPIAAGVAILRHGLYEVEVVISKAVAFALVVGVLTTVLLVVTVAPFGLTSGGGAAFLQNGSLLLGLGLGLLVVPIFRIARRIADRLVYRGRSTPYEVLSEFAERVGEAYAVEDVLPRMAQLLSAGTGARVTRVWLRGSDGTLRSEAVWPTDAPEAAPIAIRGDDDLGTDAGDAVFAVRHQGELLGALTLAMSPADPMNDTKERLAREVAGQAGLVLRNMALISDLRESRRRIVGAQDARARKLERDIHDGAQQQLVALAVKQRLAASFVGKDDARARQMLEQLQADTTDALETLRDLARGIYPPLLADKGLGAALEAQARKAAVPTTLTADGVGRYAPEVEATVYFSCLEALNNVAKYAGAQHTAIELAQTDGHLRFCVRDDGVGFDPAATSTGTGLQGIADRLAAVGGSLDVTSAPGAGTQLTGVVPAEALG